MPHGCSITIPVIAELLFHKRAQSGRVGLTVLDVGCGRGGNGAAVVTYHNQSVARLVGIDAVDTFGKCPRPLWAAYDEVHIGDAREALPKMVAAGEHFDFGLCTDVLEHNPRKDALAMLDLLPQIAGEWIVTVPDREIGVADAHMPFQGHKSQLEAQDFTSRGWQIVLPSRADSWLDLGWPMHMAHWGPTDLSLIRLVCVERSGGNATS